MRQDNNSGCTGVCKVTVGKYEYWILEKNYYQGRKILKRFSVKKLGNLGAKSQAIKFRKKILITHIKNNLNTYIL